MLAPKVSVILTSFNHGKYLREAIDSVLNQNFTDFELIIWDDASTDNSWEIICSFDDARIKAHRNIQNLGSGNINRALEVALGEYIAIHHSDDVWEPRKLEMQVELLSTSPKIGAIFTNAIAINEESDLLINEDHFYQNTFDQPNRTRYEWLRLFFTGRNVLCHPSVLIRKACYENCGLYRYGFAQIGDFDMWIRLCLKYEIHVLPEKLVRFRVRDNEANSSGNRPEVRIRNLTEFRKLLDNYRHIANFDDLVKIFPSAASYFRNEESDLDFALAMVTLEGPHIGANELFGLDILFDIISDPIKSTTVKRLYDFDYKNYIALTGQHDIFSREKILALENELSKFEASGKEQDKQVIELQTTPGGYARDIGALKGTLALSEDEKIALKDKISDLESEKSRLVAEINYIINSRSWRITAPFRWLCQALNILR